MSLSLLAPSAGAVQAMSSMDIAQLTGKRHDHVLRDIKTTLEAANIDLPKFGGIYEDAGGREYPCYYLPKFELDLVVSGYSVPYRAAIIKRWHELEAEKAAVPAPQFEIPATYAAALQLAADQARQLDEAHLQLADAAPKVEFHDAVTASDKEVTMAVACQTAKLTFGSNTAFKRLRSMGVLISGGSRHNLPLQRYIEQGLFTVNEHKFERSNGETDVSFTTHVTQKGIAWLVAKFGGEGRAAV